MISPGREKLYYALKLVQELEVRALGGDDAALADLLDLATRATEGVARLWGGMISHDTNKKIHRKEALRAAAAARTAIPVIHTNAATGRRAASDLRRLRLRKDFTANLVGWGNRPQDPLSLLLLLVDRTFASIRVRKASTSKFDSRIRNLPALSKSTTGIWASVAADWCIEEIPEGKHQEPSQLYTLIAPTAAREFSKAKQRRILALNAKYGKFIDANVATEKIGPLAATRWQEGMRKIREMTFTVTYFRTALQIVLKKRFDARLKNAPPTLEMDFGGQAGLHKP